MNVSTSNQNSTGWQEYMSKRVIPDFSGNLQEIASYAPQAPSKNNIIGAVSTVEGRNWELIYVLIFLQLYLFLNKKDIKQWYIQLNSRQLSSSWLPKTYGSELIRTHQPDEYGRIMKSYEIVSDEVTYVTRENEHCSESCSGMDFDHCFSNYIRSQMNCTLPWHPRNSSRGGPPLPLCVHPEEQELYKNAAYPLIYEADEETIFEVTGCMPCCTRDELSAKLVFTGVIDDKNEYSRFYIEDEANYIVMQLYYPNNKITVKEEYYVYDASNIIADFGGFLGLLLGYSILGFYDSSAILLKRLGAKWKKYNLQGEDSVGSVHAGGTPDPEM